MSHEWSGLRPPDGAIDEYPGRSSPGPVAADHPRGVVPAGLREGDLESRLMDVGNSPASRLVPADNPVVVELVQAVQSGDLEALEQLLEANPWLATDRFGDPDCYRSVLHVATDWPGHYPNGPAVAGRLIRAGADVNAPSRFDSHSETPLHWAASSDDIAMLDVLLDAGADIDAPGAVLGGGSPLADACGFGNWASAKRLVERGANTRLKDAAALGMLDRVKASFLDPSTTLEPAEITSALWSACHGGHQAVAEFLLQRGADPNWIGWDHMTPLDLAERNGSSLLVDLLQARGGRRAEELT